MGKNDFWSVFKASLFGIPLPLCSCGVVPTAVYMSQNKASKPAVVSFLTSTPQTGVDSILATYGMMGPVFAIYRPIAAFIMGIMNGFLTRAFIKEKPLKKDFNIGLNVITEVKPSNQDEKRANLKEKLFRYPFIEFLDDIAPQFIAGLFIAGLISFLVPDDFFADYGLNKGIIAMIIMVLVSAPMYICATASIPIAITLMMKGFSPGAAFVFLSAGPATNAASIAVLGKSIGKKSTFLFSSGIIVLSIIFGLILDQVFIISGYNPVEWFSGSHSHEHGVLSDPISLISGIILFVLLLGSIWRLYLKKYFKKKPIVEKGSTILNVSGMTCNHCAETVQKSAESAGANVKSVDYVLGNIIIEGEFDTNSVKKNIENSGYKVD